jgi:hypothetical protein
MSEQQLLHGGGRERQCARLRRHCVGLTTQHRRKNDPVSVSCPSSSFCMVVDGNGNAVSYDGTSWSSPVRIDGTTALSSISCPSSSVCMAVDWSGNVLRYNGTSWSSPPSR